MFGVERPLVSLVRITLSVPQRSLLSRSVSNQSEEQPWIHPSIPLVEVIRWPVTDGNSLVNFSLSFWFTTPPFFFFSPYFTTFFSFIWIMNAFLTFVLISLCGITNALHLPVVARHKYSGAIRMTQVHVNQIDQNVENARDVVVSN